MIGFWKTSNSQKTCGQIDECKIPWSPAASGSEIYSSTITCTILYFLKHAVGVCKRAKQTRPSTIDQVNFCNRSTI